MARLRRRFWVETGLATLTLMLAVLTAGWPQWIEALFEVEPDAGSGSLEWALLGSLTVTMAISALAARWEWRRREASA
jgi:hypothetical protein